MKDLLKRFGLDAIYGLDAETFWANDYTLNNMDTTEYVTDPRFKLHMMAVQRHDQKRARVMSPAQFKTWSKSVNWKRTGMLAHHAQFDGLICSHHYGIRPAVMFDTLSMGRALMPVTVGGSLKALCAAFGREAKKGAQILVDTKGKRDLTPKEYRSMAGYAGDDIEDTWWLFDKLLPYLPDDELDIIDLTIRMYTDPVVRIHKDEMLGVVAAEVDRKQALVAALQKSKVITAKTDLTKNDRFVAILESLGVTPPQKLSPAAKKRLEEDEVPLPEDFVYALSKQDLEFKRLLEHPDQKVRQLVEARFAVKSTNLEKKAEKLAKRADLGAVPVYLNYAGARTKRWSGSDGVNWQNMNRGSDMRKAIYAPKGYVFIIADQAQIEARFNAWFSGQNDKVEAFRNKVDVYKLGATGIYNKSIDLITKDERFVGKTAELGLGYQAGGPRFAGMLRIGQFGPPVDISDGEAYDTVRAWRLRNNMIVRGWKETQQLMLQAFVNKTKIEHRHGIVYERAGDVLYIHHMPTGMSMRFDDVQWDGKNLSYLSKFQVNKIKPPTLERKKLYGGLEVENRTQFIARNSVAANAVTISRTMKRARIANTTHDELLLVVPSRSAERMLRDVVEIMETPPVWAPGMPFGVDAHISERYDK